jgi:hypothetical protein
MEKLLITIHNSETGEIETREMNDAEIQQVELRKTRLSAEATAQAEAEKAKAAAQAKLAALGLTTDDLKALGL